MNVFKLVVDFHEGKKDYVSAKLYHNDQYYRDMEDISKPEDAKYYDANWKNGLINHYLEIAKSDLPLGSVLVSL